MKTAPLKVGILTGGGDAPGLNGIIESTSRTLLQAGVEVFGIRNGFEGIFKKDFFELNLENVVGLHTQPGTTLGTSNKTGTAGREAEFLDAFKATGLDALVVAGGDGTFRGLQVFEGQIPMVGVPKTIDNDLSGTDITFGYDSACSVVGSAVDSLKHTAKAHHRIFVVETMGRDSGWIALGGGLSSYADVILLPEKPFSKEELKTYILKKKAEGRTELMIVVSEGAHPQGEEPMVAFRVEGSPQADRYGGIAERLARWVEQSCDWEARHVVLGHLQRSVYPTTTDRFLTLAMGVQVAQLVINRQWNQAAVYRNGRVTTAPLTDLMGEARLVPHDHRWIAMAQALGIFI